jgi:pyruvate dehydrogenase E1 component alpha subunit/2-oxoisovalerate dehydrogenase E1 component alpha subunit
MSRLDRNELHELFYFMKLSRRLEEELLRLHGEGKVPGPLGFVFGREAVSVGAAYRLDFSDKIVSSIASVGSSLVRGVQPVEIFAHFMGKSAGPSKGRDNGAHFGDFQRGLLPPASHLSTHLGVMAGIALASKAKGESSIGLAIMDVRGMDTGDFHESLNFAAVHRLPLVVLVEGAASNAPSIDDRVRGYGIPGLPLDGADVLQVLQGFETAADRARSGKGPTVIEARTHYGPVPESRSGSVPFAFPQEARRSGSPATEELNDAILDPVTRFESFLTDHGLLGLDEHQVMNDRIDRLLESDLEKAEAGSFPDSALLLDGVFAGSKDLEH